MKINKQMVNPYPWGNGCEGWHLVNRDGMSVIQEQMPPQTSETPHFHEHARQFFYILSGTAVMEVNGEEITLLAQDGLEIAPGTPHCLKNVSEDRVEFLVFSTPHSHNDKIYL